MDAEFDRLAAVVRGKVRSLQYVMTLHAEEEMDGDGLTIADVEHALLGGRITERQRDRVTREWKYVVTGSTRAGRRAGIVVKLSPAGKLVIITVYLM